MARDRANIMTGIWGDSDWRKLTVGAQHLYLLILTHSTLNYAGVGDWRPARLAAMTAGETAESIEKAGAELVASHFLYTDEVTEEVLVRSYLRHDGLLKHPRLPISMAKDYAGVSSESIRSYVAFELQKLSLEQPELALWKDHRVQAILKAESKDLKAESKGYRNPLAKELNSDPMHTATTTATTTKKDSLSEVADATPRPEILDVLDYLDSGLAFNGFKKPARTKKNQDAIRLLIDRDGFTPEQIKYIIEWTCNDEFWRPNVLSASKLREKFPQLMAKAGVGKTAAPTAGFGGEIDPDAILGKDYWVPGTPPADLTMQEEMVWKDQQIAAHKTARLEEAKRRVSNA